MKQQAKIYGMVLSGYPVAFLVASMLEQTTISAGFQLIAVLAAFGATPFLMRWIFTKPANLKNGTGIAN